MIHLFCWFPGFQVWFLQVSPGSGVPFGDALVFVSRTSDPVFDVVFDVGPF